MGPSVVTVPQNECPTAADMRHLRMHRIAKAGGVAARQLDIEVTQELLLEGLTFLHTRHTIGYAGRYSYGHWRRANRAPDMCWCRCPASLALHPRGNPLPTPSG